MAPRAAIYITVRSVTMTAAPVSPVDQTPAPSAGGTTDPMQQDLRARVARLAAFRTQHAAAKATVAALREQFDALHTEELAREQTLRAAVEEADEAIRVIAGNLYLTTGERAPAPGVTVKVTTEVEYDAAEAHRFATAKGMFLTFDKKNFDKVAASLGLPWVQVSERPAVSIARDLDAALGGA